jgi:hypothetical protein
MEHQLKRRALSAVIVAAAIVTAGCGGGGSGGTSDTALPSLPSATGGSTETSAVSGSSSSTVPESATLHVSASRVDVNDTEVPNGATRPLQLDEPVVLDREALADIQTGDLGIELLLGAKMRLDSWAQPELRSSIDAGHLRVTVDANTTARFRLSTWTKIVLTTLQPGTVFTVCQTPAAPPEEPVTCLDVEKGAVEWEAKGASTILTAGQSTFSKNGDPPSVVVCLPSGDVDTWYQAALRHEPVDDLGVLVSNALPCPGDGSAVTTAAPGTTQGTGHRPRPPGTTQPPPTDAQPPPTDTTPPPLDTPPPPVDTTPPPVDTTPPPVDTTPPPVDTTPPPVDTTPPVT